MMTDFELFKQRKIKAKSIFNIDEICVSDAYEFVKKYHYLGDNKLPMCLYAYGLFHTEKNELVGCATYSHPQGVNSLKSWFGLDNSRKDVVELSRLCLLPELNGTNATSYLLSGSIRKLKKHGVRAVTTLACSERHVGSIYQVCNFKYYGLSDAKTDFFSEDGRINPRGKTKDLRGVWLPRPKKYRYAYIMDNSLICKYAEQEKPKVNEKLDLYCCGGSNRVYDKRFGVWYTCPRCCGKLERIGGVDVKKTDEEKIIIYETDKFFDVSLLKSREPELFEDLVRDYPCEKAIYEFKVVG